MTIGHFMLGAYGILTLVAGFLVMNGASLLDALAIFIFPTVLLAEGLWFAWRQEKSPANLTQKVLKMTKSVDFPGKPFDMVMDSLETQFGENLPCDMRGYMGDTHYE